MRIPDKYRDRYDRLALGHPWMREMRDETNGINGETNGIADEITLPEDDAVSALRMYASFWNLKNYLQVPHCDNWESKTMKLIADMVERDYVHREAYDDLKDEFAWMSSFLHRVGKQCGTKDVPSLKAYVEQLEAKVAEQKVEIGKYEHDCSILWDEKAKLEAERDEAVEAYDKHMEAHDAWHEAEDIKYTRNRFSVLEKAKNERIAKLESERDEWRDKAEQAHETMDRMQEVIDGYEDSTTDLEMEISELKVKSAKRAAAVKRLRGLGEHVMASSIQWALFGPERDNMPPNELRDALVDLLTDDAEGSSKVRAGSSERAAAAERLRGMTLSTGSAVKKLAIALDVKWNPDNAPLSMSKLQNRLVELLEDDELRSDDGATNLEWLFKHDREKLLDLASENIGCKGTFDCPDLVNGECTNQNPNMHEACYKRLREWLMAPHDDAHSKAQSKTEPTLTEQSESLSDEGDSREKLEADVRKYLDLPANCRGWGDYKAVCGWLDRQAAISERELEDTFLDRADKVITRRELVQRELQTKVDELQRENTKLSSDEVTARANCEYWRGQHDAMQARFEKLRERLAAMLDES